MKYHIFSIIILGFLIGVLVQSLHVFSLFHIYTTIIISVVVFLFYLIRLEKNSNFILLCGVFVLVFGLGMTRFHLADKGAPKEYVSLVGQSVSLQGVVVDEPDEREKNTKLLVEVSGKRPFLEEEQSDGKGKALRSGFEKTKILFTANSGRDYKYGDEISFKGVLERPKNFMTDQGKEFDYIHYLEKDGIYFVMQSYDINTVSRGQGNPVKSWLFDFKNKFMSRADDAISAPESTFLGGLILGEKSAFDKAMRDSFVKTGTIHIIALSGYNVTIVAEGVMKFISYISSPRSVMMGEMSPRAGTFGIGAGIFAIMLFIIMTGASSTAIRAGIMSTLALLARATGRTSDAGRALFLAGFLMILWNPFLLVYDVSFQLSFIATFSVIFFAPRMEKYFFWVTEKFGLRDVITVTVSAYIFVLPFILYKMGNLSIVALPANVLILPFIPLTMLLGFLAGIFGLIFPVLGLPFGYFAYLFLHYELQVIKFFSDLPFASFSIGHFPMVLTILAYGVMLWWIFKKDVENAFRSPTSEAL